MPPGPVPPEIIELALGKLTKAIGTPQHLKSIPAAVILAMASMVGNLERLTLRTAGTSMDIVRDGYLCVPNFTPNLRDLLAPPEWTEAVVNSIQEQMSERGPKPISSAAWLTVLASTLGQLSAHHGVPPETLESIIGKAWELTSPEDVERFQRLSRSAGGA